MYDFDKVHDRRGTGCVKWDKQYGFGVKDGLLPFWIADTDFATLPEIPQAIAKRLEHPLVGYSDVYDECTQAISAWYERRHGYKVPESAMLLASGVVTSIRFTLHAVTQPGDKVMVFTPVYDPFFAVIKNSDREMVDCQLVLENNTYSIDFAKMEEQMKDGVKAVILCNPHNPIGRVWTYAELEQVAALCEKYGAYMLADEIHGDVTLFDHKYTTMSKFENIHDKLVVYTAISKTFNMAGLVSSCMFIFNPELKKAVDDELSKSWLFGPNALAYSAITAAYTHGDTWVDEQNAYLSGNVELVESFMAENLPLVQVTKQEGTFLMWIDFSCLGMTSAALCKLMADKYKLAIADGSHYGHQAEGYMRFNIGCSREMLQKGLDLLHTLYKDVLGGNNNG